MSELSITQNADQCPSMQIGDPDELHSARVQRHDLMRNIGGGDGES